MFQKNDHTFFAAANTPNGFQSYFPQIFEPENFEKIFILKGGPGTGKSSFMRIISKIAQEKGYQTEEFLCSSDPKSLDGLIIPNKKLAIIDGTAPHTIDPTYPGVIESMINTGVFWDTEKLCKDKALIISLIQNKKRYFKRAYQFLNAWGDVELEILKIGEKALLQNKMDQSIERIFRKIHLKETSKEEVIRSQTAINAKGYTKLNTFEKRSETIYVIEDLHCTGVLCLSKVYSKAKKIGMKIVKSPSCAFPDRYDSLFFPEQKICFVLGSRDYANEISGKTYHYINMKRFLDASYLQDNKNKLKFGRKCSEMLWNGAIEAFSEAAEAHNELEKKYIEAMDFKAWEGTISTFVKENIT